MIDFLIRYYFKSPQGRVVCFERPARFPALPFPGSQLMLEVDCLKVEHVHFHEDSRPVLIVEDWQCDDSAIEDAIVDMKEQGWVVASDNRKRR